MREISGDVRPDGLLLRVALERLGALLAPIGGHLVSAKWSVRRVRMRFIRGAIGTVHRMHRESAKEAEQPCASRHFPSMRSCPRGKRLRCGSCADCWTIVDRLTVTS